MTYNLYYVKFCTLSFKHFIYVLFIYIVGNEKKLKTKIKKNTTIELNLLQEDSFSKYVIESS